MPFNITYQPISTTNSPSLTKPPTSQAHNLSSPLTTSSRVSFSVEHHNPSDLVGADNRAKLTDAVQKFYRRYMAFAISRNMRAPTSASTANVTYTGTLLGSTTPRLKQNNASKITLQVLLAVMFVCGCLAYWLTNIRHTLPHEPYSIAGAASLLAGSEICSARMMDGVPDGAEWMSKRELEENRVWEGWLISLGWWNRGGNKIGRKFGIDLGRADRDP
jgi:hypothetical protein